MMDPRISGNVQLAFMSVSSTARQIHAGKLRALAVTSGQRTPALPDLPTLQGLGFTGYDISTGGIVCSGGTPAGNRAEAPCGDAEGRRNAVGQGAFAPHGLEATSDSPQEFAAFVKDETQRYARIAKSAGIQPE